MSTVPKGGVNTGYPESTGGAGSVAVAGGAAAVAFGGAGVVLMRRRKHSTMLEGAPSEVTHR